MRACPFCRVAAEAIGTTLLQSTLAVAFLDIRPIRPGHALVVPRRHEPDFWKLTLDEHHQILALARQLAEAQRKLFDPRRVGLVVAGFDVPHAHVHVVPLLEVHDVTSDAILKGTLRAASADELAGVRKQYAGHFLATKGGPPGSAGEAAKLDR